MSPELSALPATLPDALPDAIAPRGHDPDRAPAVDIQPDDILVVPHRKRLVPAYATSATGARELVLSYGVHEITFDDDRLFPFAETLLEQSSFAARSATSWGPGYDWAEVGPLLRSFVELGIVTRDGAAQDTRGTGLVPPLLPPAPCKIPRTWSAADTESITRELAGRAVEIGYIEAFVFTFRLAHSAIDADGRQVGEANVYPPRLRVDQDTEWRVCQYQGSRYRDHAPMNVTALKAMIKYWKPMMVTLLATRAEVKRRLPRSQDRWTLGDLHTFANVVLTLPAYVLLQGGGASPQPPLDPVLSSLFRITDGVRMVTHEMLFRSDGQDHLPADRTGAVEMFDFAERRGLFLTDTGVCAGPRTMIDEFLAIVCDGRAVEGTSGLVPSPPVATLLAELPAAVEYGLLALQVWTVVRSLWLVTSEIHDSVRALIGTARGPACDRLRERLDRDREILVRARLGGEHERAIHHRVHADTYEQAWRGLDAPVGPMTLAERTSPGPEGPADRRAARQLCELLTARMEGSDLGPAATARLACALVHHVRREQAILAAATELEDAINQRLGRPPPTRPLTARDCRVAWALRNDALSGFPYLLDTIEDALGIGVDVTRDTVEICDRRRAEA